MQGLHGNPSILALPLSVDMYGLSDACVLWMMSIPCHVCRIRGLGLLSSAYLLDHHLAGLSSSGGHDSGFPAGAHSTFGAFDLFLSSNILKDIC